MQVETIDTKSFHSSSPRWLMAALSALMADEPLMGGHTLLVSHLDHSRRESPQRHRDNWVERTHQDTCIALNDSCKRVWQESPQHP